MATTRTVRPLRDRLLSRAIINWETGCWEWEGARNSYGYGSIQYQQQGHGVHRLAWLVLVGPIPPGLELDHLCRVRHCLNPAHLEPVTNRVNNLRGQTFAAANAAKTRCPQGHEYDPLNTYTDPAGRRHCRACKRLRDRGRDRRSS